MRKQYSNEANNIEILPNETLYTLARLFTALYFYLIIGTRGWNRSKRTGPACSKGGYYLPDKSHYPMDSMTSHTIQWIAWIVFFFLLMHWIEIYPVGDGRQIRR